jgi:NTP pyrophosphatase (non-canonical NTP hydrolase)
MTSDPTLDSILTPLCGGMGNEHARRGSQRPRLPIVGRLDSPSHLLAEFHEWAYNEHYGEGTKDASLRMTLHREERDELVEALQANAPAGVGMVDYLTAILKELADVAYVAYGTAHSLGLPLDAAIQLIHSANLSKADENGQAILRPDGKVLKGPNYRPPEPALRQLVAAELTRRGVAVE